MVSAYASTSELPSIVQIAERVEDAFSIFFVELNRIEAVFPLH